MIDDFSNYKVELVKNVNIINETNSFIKNNHYLGTLARGCPFKFVLRNHKNRIVGAAQVGICVGKNVTKAYGYEKNELKELRRFCLEEDVPPNTASWFISKILKYLNVETNIKAVISYADQNQGHEGIIYQASNFVYVGITKPTEVIKYQGKTYHLRTIYGNGRLVDQGIDKSIIINALKSGGAKRIYLKPKIIFIYDFKKNNPFINAI